MRSPEELAYAWRDALLACDADRFTRLFAPDGVLLDVESRTPDGARPRPVAGREEILRTTKAWLAATPRFRYRSDGSFHTRSRARLAQV